LPAAVDRAARLLEVSGAVHPAACEAQTLLLRTQAGGELRGESAHATQGGALAGVRAAGPPTPAPDAVITALRDADAVVISGPRGT
jgi:2-phospho-L-lactate transferase/gluconeogenesis factor (CofD/UPF0052 family)